MNARLLVLCGLWTTTLVSAQVTTSPDARSEPEVVGPAAAPREDEASSVAPASTSSTRPSEPAPSSAEPAPPSAPTLTPEPSPSPTWESAVVNATLDNGLLARVQQRRDSSFAAVCVTYAVGSADDPEGYEGLAHLSEHLMFAPFPGLPEGFGRYVDALGASFVNAATSSESTEYCTEVPAEALDAVLFAEATRVGFLLGGLDEDDVERERAAVLHEQRERGRTEVALEVARTLARALWGAEHPYAHERETEDSVERIQLAHVRWFLQRWYGPANATLAVVSPEDPAHVHARIAHYFAGLRGATPPERPMPPLPEPDSARFTVLAPLLRDQLLFAWTTPRFHEPEDAALDVVADIVEERLGDLFEDDDEVRGVSASVYSRARGSVFTITIQGDDEVDLEPRIALVHEALATLRREGPTTTEVAEARRRWARSLGGARRSLLTVARRLASSRVHGQPELPVRDSRYAILDHEAVVAALRRWIDPEREVLVQRRMHPFAPRRGSVRRRSLR